MTRLLKFLRRGKGNKTSGNLTDNGSGSSVPVSGQTDKPIADPGFQPRSGQLPQSIQHQILDEVQAFTFGKQYASGLRAILRYLDEYPGNSFVLQLASMLIYSGMSYSSAYEAAGGGQQLPKDLLMDTRLDSIFNECSKCGNCWIPAGQIVAPYRKMSAVNAVGARCARCDIVLCRNCLANQHLGVDASIMQCPECGGWVEPLNEPTGRRPRQARRRKEKIVYALVIRHGPIPPDESYLNDFFRAVAPDVLENVSQAKISALPMQEWDDIAKKAFARLMVQLPDLSLETVDIDRVEGVFDEDRFYLLRVYEKPAGSPPVSHTPAIDNRSAINAEGGILFWFDWSEISNAGHGAYGRYVYEQLLPFFSPGEGIGEISRFYEFLDGDCIPRAKLQLPYRGEKEKRYLDEVVQRGIDSCYVVAVHGFGSLDFARIDSALKDEGVHGYIGMTSAALGFEDFYKLTGEMALVNAFTLRGNHLDISSFGFLGHAELESMGFVVNHE